MKMKEKVLDMMLFFLWTAIGFIVLFEGVDRISFSCLLICYLTELGLKIANNDNKTGGVA